MGRCGGSPAVFDCPPHGFCGEHLNSRYFFGANVHRAQKFPDNHIKTEKSPGFPHFTDGAHDPTEIPARLIEPGTLALEIPAVRIFLD